MEHDVFLVALPGTEETLAGEARAAGFAGVHVVAGGVEVAGGRAAAERANRELRCASRVLLRIARFRALHLAQLDKRARKVDWAGHLRPDVAVRIEAACRKSRIYHAGAAGERIARAIAESVGAPTAPSEGDAPVRVMARIDDDLVTISLDTTGEPLHRRGHKPAVGKAPLRETMAAIFLRECGYDGREPVVDPMCGSGTFVIEAAEIAAGLLPGRDRAFAFERLAAAGTPGPSAAPRSPGGAVVGFGYDRDDGAVRRSVANADAAGIAAITSFARQSVSDLVPPAEGPGLVIVNPPYGGRIGERKLLFALYGAFGATVRARFRGWRVGLVTSDAALAGATGLPFGPPGPPVPHGGLKVRLYRTGPLR